jgi:hypothetical protein
MKPPMRHPSPRQVESFHFPKHRVDVGYVGNAIPPDLFKSLGPLYLIGVESFLLNIHKLPRLALPQAAQCFLVPIVRILIDQVGHERRKRHYPILENVES